MHVIDHILEKKIERIFESNNDTGAVINEVLFNNTLSTLGTGFSFQTFTAQSFKVSNQDLNM